jgi:hypothetical protein
MGTNSRLRESIHFFEICDNRNCPGDKKQKAGGENGEAHCGEFYRAAAIYTER